MTGKMIERMTFKQLRCCTKMAFDDLLADGEADPGARPLASVQALENDEDAVEVLGLDAHAVVGDGDLGEDLGAGQASPRSPCGGALSSQAYRIVHTAVLKTPHEASC